MGKQFNSDDSGYGLCIKLLICAVIAWIGFEAYRTLLLPQSSGTTVNASQKKQSLDLAAPRPQSSDPSQADRQTAQSLDSSRTPATSGQVYRCGNTYTNEACKGGQRIDTSPSVSNPDGALTKEIYLCKNADGQRYWESDRCALRGRTLDRVARLPANLSWDEQVAIARQQLYTARANAAEQIVPTTVASPSASNSNAAECRALEEQVRLLDSECRASACSMQRLDRVREHRRLARDRQFRIRC